MKHYWSSPCCRGEPLAEKVDQGHSEWTLLLTDSLLLQTFSPPAALILEGSSKKEDVNPSINERAIGDNEALHLPTTEAPASRQLEGPTAVTPNPTVADEHTETTPVGHDKERDGRESVQIGSYNYGEAEILSLAKQIDELGDLGEEWKQTRKAAAHGNPILFRIYESTDPCYDKDGKLIPHMVPEDKAIMFLPGVGDIKVPKRILRRQRNLLESWANDKKRTGVQLDSRHQKQKFDFERAQSRTVVLFYALQQAVQRVMTVGQAKDSDPHYGYKLGTERPFFGHKFIDKDRNDQNDDYIDQTTVSEHEYNHKKVVSQVFNAANMTGKPRSVMPRSSAEGIMETKEWLMADTGAMKARPPPEFGTELAAPMSERERLKLFYQEQSGEAEKPEEESAEHDE